MVKLSTSICSTSLPVCPPSLPAIIICDVLFLFEILQNIYFDVSNTNATSLILKVPTRVHLSKDMTHLTEVWCTKCTHVQSVETYTLSPPPQYDAKNYCHFHISAKHKKCYFVIF